jgi:Holliday junction DNA helicase RuvA
VISLLRGEVAVRRSDHVVVLCGGVGYRLAVSTETLRRVPPVGQQTSLHAHLVVRDDALALYGFASEEERELFLLLLAVQNVGPKVALAVLCGGPARELAAAIGAGDAVRFQATPGIGKRTAERIVVELRDRVGDSGFATPLGGADAELVVRRGDDPRGIARAGLLELGFSAVESERLLADARGDSAEELIADALRAARA